MRGHERIVEMRREHGLRPAAVFVTDAPVYADSLDIHIERGDVPEALDLRFLTGLLVHVSVEDTPKGRRIADACTAAAKRTVTAYASLAPKTTADHCIRITDTKENAEWKF